MLTRDVTFEGWTATDWSRFVSMFAPVRREPSDPARPRGGVIAIHAAGRLEKLLHTRAGRLDPREQPWPIALGELAARHHASWAFSAHMGALDEVMERFGARARKADDISVQSLAILEIVRELLQENAIQTWPRRLQGIPLPTPALVESTLDALCPDGRVLLVGIFRGGELWTSIALAREGSGFSRIVGPEELRPEMGLLSGDWRRDYRHLARAVEQHVGPLALGCFAEFETLRALEVDPSPGAWARAAAVRDVIFAPLTAALAIPLGIDAARTSLVAFRSVAERFDLLGVVPPLARRLREATGGLAPHERFTPLDALRKLLAR